MESGSVTHWIGQIKDGNESSAEEQLCDRYLARLTSLARWKLADLPPQIRDDEDVALGALSSFLWRAKRGDFPQLRDRHDLWRLLARITVRKSIDQRRNACAQKRGAEHVRAAVEFEENVLDFDDNTPPPDMLAAIKEEFERLMNVLEEDLRPVAQMKLEGYTNREIAETMGRVERTVERKLDRIRHAWLKSAEVL